jgi:alpha-beta hydrolase superfamily lysophospholipase
VFTRVEMPPAADANGLTRIKVHPDRLYILGMSATLSREFVRIDQRPEQFSVASFDGTPIAYDVYDAPNISTILIIPGFWRTKDHPSMTALAAKLQERGHRSIVVDLRGHGASGGVFGFNDTEHFDIDAVVAAAAPETPLAILGFSSGASIGITAVAEHPHRWKSLLLISAVADFRTVVPKINPFTIHRHIALSQALARPRFRWRFRSRARRASDDIRRVHIPLSLVHVKNDWLIDHRHSVALYEAANEPKELHIIDIPGNYHADRIFSVAGQRIYPIMWDFLDRTLEK